MANTLVHDDTRAAIAKDETVGAGNFLAAALKVSGDPNLPVLHLEVPFVMPDGSSVYELSLRDLEFTSDRIASWYHEKDVKPHDPIGVYMRDGIEYLLHYLALTKLGPIPVLTNGNLAGELAALHFQRIGVVGVVGDAEHLRALNVSSANLGFRVNHLEVKSDAKIPASAIFKHVDDDPIMIAHSSGTTGVPKPVLLQHQPFFHGIRYRLSMPRIHGGETILSSLPHSHNCAIAYIMLALLSGTPIYITTDHSGLNVLRRIEEFKPTMVVSFPQTYVEVTEQDLDRFDLKSVNLWFNGGDAAHESHIRKLIAQGSRRQADGSVVAGSAFIDGMGSSEMGFSLFRHVHTPGSNRYGRCVGRPLEWVEAAVLSDTGEKLAPYVVGRLGVKAPSVTRGYWNNSLLSFRSRLRGYWLTGDLAYQDGDGFFYHVDRVPDQIDTPEGKLYSLETEELILSRNPSVSDCSIFRSTSGKAVCLVRAHAGAEVPTENILANTNAALAQLGRGQLDQVLVVESTTIPHGTTGKVLKRRLRDELAAL
jgi:acyl-coenzyme A synthetase/AMP-(fatty) acid ligase